MAAMLHNTSPLAASSRRMVSFAQASSTLPSCRRQSIALTTILADTWAGISTFTCLRAAYVDSTSENITLGIFAKAFVKLKTASSCPDNSFRIGACSR
eukprot:457707-Pyramimonas_sp.AAC.1